LQTAPIANASRPWFVSAPVDLLCQGGLSLLVFAYCRLTDFGEERHHFVAITGLFLLNWPHFAATSVRLYGSRANIAQYPLTAIVIPLAAVGAVVGCFLSPLWFAPVFFKVFLIWSPFHYCGQTVGVSLLYARRDGFPINAWLRRALVAFVYLTFLSQTGAGETSAIGGLYYGVVLPGFGIPPELASVLGIAMKICGALALVGIAGTALAYRRAPPLSLLLVPLSQYVWFVHGAGSPGFREMVPSFHSLQYLAIAWAMHDGSKRQVNEDRVSSRSRLARWIALNLSGGFVLFNILPFIPGRLGYVEPALATGAILGAIQLHHFFVDGVIWKLRSRAVSAPLRAEGEGLGLNPANVSLGLAA
jgi:hypothetical protein